VDPNQAYSAAEVERMMKLQDVLLKAMAGKMRWWEAAEIIGGEQGILLADRILDDDVYDLALAKIPESILPRGDVEAMSCRRR